MTTALALRDVAVTVALEAARLVRERRAAGVSVAATKVSALDVVTEADRASEELIAARLAELRPGDGFLGEEGHDEPGTTGVRWVVDPIDGTVNYLYDIPQYAVSIAAEVDGTTLAGAVVNAATGVVHEAALGHGARRDGATLAVREPAPVDRRLLLTGFSYETAVKERQGAAVARLLPRVRDVRRMGSAALDLCAVAAGLADGYLEEAGNPWDWDAGRLIAGEAGARSALLTGASGRDLLLCAPAHGFDELLALAGDCGFLAPA